MSNTAPKELAGVVNEAGMVISAFRVIKKLIAEARAAKNVDERRALLDKARRGTEIADAEIELTDTKLKAFAAKFATNTGTEVPDLSQYDGATAKLRELLAEIEQELGKEEAALAKTSGKIGDA